MRAPRFAVPIASSTLAVALLAVGCGEAGGGVYPTAEAVEPLSAGASVPSVRVHTVRGEPVDLAGLVRERGALLVFFRGGW